MTYVPALAQMMYDNHRWGDDGWWVFGMIFMGLFWVAVIGLVVWLIVRVTHASATPAVPAPKPGEGAREILAERYARGEITTEEYRERLDHLA